MMDDVIDVFLYGLFMDTDALRARGLNPSNPRKGQVCGMALLLGTRATLVHRAEFVVHGLVMTLAKSQLDSLYSEPSVAAYRPQTISVECADGAVVPAICYNLPSSGDLQENMDYSLKLRAVAQKMGLPPEYIQTIGQI